MTASRRPLRRYDQLPIDATKPPRSSWGVFGEDDELGTLNLIGAEEVRRAVGLVRAGRVFPLNWSLGLPDPAILGRGRMRRTPVEQSAGLDDYYDNFHPQSSSQWDALAHVRHPEWGWYNGHRPLEDATRLDIGGVARRGIAARFVLIDVAADRERRGEPLDCGASVSVTVAELAEVLERAGTTLASGDVLLIRFGWTAWYEQLDQAGRDRLGDGSFFPAPGLAAEEETARWLWDNGVAAVAADCPALEAMPFDQRDERGFLHYRLIPLLGMTLGELLDLEALAQDCRRDGVYEGLFTAAPLNVSGGAGSPANALAIK